MVGHLAAWLGQAAWNGGDTDVVAKEGRRFDDHIAKVDTDAQFDAAPRPNIGALLGHCLLHLDRARGQSDDTAKLHQHAVASGLNDAAAVLGDFRIDQLVAQRFEAS